MGIPLVLLRYLSRGHVNPAFYRRISFHSSATLAFKLVVVRSQSVVRPPRPPKRSGGFSFLRDFIALHPRGVASGRTEVAGEFYF